MESLHALENFAEVWSRVTGGGEKTEAAPAAASGTHALHVRYLEELSAGERRLRGLAQGADGCLRRQLCPLAEGYNKSLGLLRLEHFLGAGTLWRPECCGSCGPRCRRWAENTACLRTLYLQAEAREAGFGDMARETESPDSARRLLCLAELEKQRLPQLEWGILYLLRNC